MRRTTRRMTRPMTLGPRGYWRVSKENVMTNPGTNSERTPVGSEDKGSKAGLAAILPLIIMTVLAILVLVWIVAH